MPERTYSLKQLWTLAKSLIPVISVTISMLLWVDNRYLLKDLSDIRETENKLEYYNRELRGYEQQIKEGDSLDSEEQRDYDLLTLRTQKLLSRKNKMMGLDENE